MGDTPDLSHLASADYQLIYEPAEDTFLLMDALMVDLKDISDIQPLVCLEIGSGSGAVMTFLAKLLGPTSFYMCTDINSNAALATQKTGRQNGVVLNPILTDLVSSVLPRLVGAVDILVFNPPYVVTPDEEVFGRGIEASWAGGERGRRVMDRLFPLVPSLLSENGIFYLVTIKENDSGDIEERLSRLGLQMSVLLSRRCGPERLSVLKFTRRKAEAERRPLPVV